VNGCDIFGEGKEGRETERLEEGEMGE